MSGAGLSPTAAPAALGCAAAAAHLVRHPGGGARLTEGDARPPRPKPPARTTCGRADRASRRIVPARGRDRPAPEPRHPAARAHRASAPHRDTAAGDSRARPARCAWASPSIRSPWRRGQVIHPHVGASKVIRPIHPPFVSWGSEPCAPRATAASMASAISQHAGRAEGGPHGDADDWVRAELGRDHTDPQQHHAHRQHKVEGEPHPHLAPAGGGGRNALGTRLPSHTSIAIGKKTPAITRRMPTAICTKILQGVMRKT